MPLKRSRNDEFYTTYESIDNIYKTGYIDLDYFKDKKIYCNCDDYRSSNYVKWWKDNFYELGISELIATNYDIGEGAYVYRFDGMTENVEKGIDDGSFERYDYLIDADTVISTNPPFSKSREYYDFLHRANAKYYVHSTVLQTVKFCKDINLTYFNKSGTGHLVLYDVPSWDRKDVWVTGSGITSNIGFTKTISKVELKKTFAEIPHDFYYEDDIYEKGPWKGMILNVDKCNDIPIDYNGFMGVPVTFIMLQPEYRDMFEIYDIIFYGNKFYRLRVKRKDC